MTTPTRTYALLDYSQMDAAKAVISDTVDRLGSLVDDLRYLPGKVSIQLTVTRGGDVLEATSKVEYVAYQHAHAEPPKVDDGITDALVEVEVTTDARPEDVL